MKLKPINITVNGKPYKVYDTSVSYEELADMAGIPIKDDIREFARKKFVQVDDGMVIDVK